VIAYLVEGTRNRLIRDVDILVDPMDLQRSLDVLAAADFRRTIDAGTLKDYTAFVAHSPGSAGNLAISLTWPLGIGPR
jgi:hypothetical protein